MSKHGIAIGYFGIEDVMALTGKSLNTITAMVKQNRLPMPLKDGKRNVWDKAELERWIKNGKHLIPRK